MQCCPVSQSQADAGLDRLTTWRCLRLPPLLPPCPLKFERTYSKRPSFLTSLNEYGYPKFLPTTVTPTCLPYQYVHACTRACVVSTITFESAAPSPAVTRPMLGWLFNNC
eukprot:GHVU01154711.1.p1 GENE.GHVU01154711.1~~GHVU01154711.1.p1  ORF type:complete len:110 (-),score=4.60 GHVU01154711.1:756-1085(-)